VERVARHEQAERICELAKSAAAGDADTALPALAELRREVDAYVRVHVSHALEAGRSYGDVARMLGISRQAAHSRFRELAPSDRPPRKHPLVATEAARRAVRLAQVEAQAAGAPPGSGHVLLGILRTDCDATRALRFDGVTPERVRACLQNGAGDGRDLMRGREATDSREATSIRSMLKHAARLAINRGRHELDLEELLLAALADPDGGARRTLTALTVDPASVHERLSSRRR
jgi:hypothetical protein